MAAAKTKAIEAPEPQRSPADLLNDVVFFALPAPLFKELSDEAAKRQMTLAVLLSTAVHEFLLKTDPSSKKVEG